MKIGRVSSKVMLGAFGAVILATAVVLAAVLSAQVTRTQDVFNALEMTVTPDPFPDITIGVNPTAELIVAATVQNPNPIDLDVTVMVTLLAIEGCLVGTVTVNPAAHDLCLSPYTTPSQLIIAGNLIGFDMTFVYSNTFLGRAEYTFQAEGIAV